MLDFPTQIMGVNAPKEHQRVIRKLVQKLGDLYEKWLIKYEPFPEVMIDASQTSATPDILLYDNVLNQNIVLIEIVADGWKRDFRKATELAEEYQLNEGFVYNYIRKEWLKYDYNKGEISKNKSFCDAIGYDLNDFIQ